MAPRRIYFPLRLILSDALKSINCSEPEFVDVSEEPGFHQYCVRYTTKAHCRIDHDNSYYPHGSKRRSAIAAENSAADIALFSLRYDDAITVTDYSYADYLRLKKCQSKVLSSIFSMERSIMRCCYDLRDVLDEAEYAHSRCFMFELTAIDRASKPLVFCALSDLCRQIEEYFIPADRRLASLTVRANLLLDEFCEGSHYLMSDCLPQRRVVAVCMKMMLVVVLDMLGFSPPLFGVKELRGGSFRSHVKMHLHNRLDCNCGAQTVIFSGEELSASDAEQAVARTALCFLEDELQIGIFDYHRDRLDGLVSDIGRLQDIEKEIRLFSDELSTFCTDMCTELMAVRTSYVSRLGFSCSEDSKVRECSAVLFDTLYYMCVKCLRFA